MEIPVRCAPSRQWGGSSTSKSGVMIFFHSADNSRSRKKGKGSQCEITQVLPQTSQNFCMIMKRKGDIQIILDTAMIGSTYKCAKNVLVDNLTSGVMASYQ